MARLSTIGAAGMVAGGVNRHRMKAELLQLPLRLLAQERIIKPQDRLGFHLNSRLPSKMAHADLAESLGVEKRLRPLNLSQLLFRHLMPMWNPRGEACVLRPVPVGQSHQPSRLAHVPFLQTGDRKSTRLNSSHSQISY